jgi:hypothetical protein
MNRNILSNSQNDERKENNQAVQTAAATASNIVTTPSIFILSAGVSSVINTHNIHARLRELYFILESEYKENLHIEESLYWCALLGAVARLFETLKDSKCDLLNKQFMKGARDLIYHCKAPFSDFDCSELITFFSHCYEHCRVEMGSLLGDRCLPLTCPMDLAERTKPYFTEIINYSFDRSGIDRSEIKDLAIDRLGRNKKKFIELLAYLKENPNCLHNESDPNSNLKSDIIVGSAISTELAWLACDASSLLYGRAANSHTDSRKYQLKKGEKKRIRREYGDYIKPGNYYRHCEIALYPILNKYGIGLCKLRVHLDQIYDFFHTPSLPLDSSMAATPAQSASSAIGYCPQDSLLHPPTHVVPNTASIPAHQASGISVSSWQLGIFRADIPIPAVGSHRRIRISPQELEEAKNSLRHNSTLDRFP